MTDQTRAVDLRRQDHRGQARLDPDPARGLPGDGRARGLGGRRRDTRTRRRPREGTAGPDSRRDGARRASGALVSSSSSTPTGSPAATRSGPPPGRDRAVGDQGRGDDARRSRTTAADPRMASMAASGRPQHRGRARKSKATKRGLSGARSRASRSGQVPLGYKVVKKVVEDDKVITTRVIDPATRPMVERIFDLVEAASTFGEVARILNAEGISPDYGAGWWDRTVSEDHPRPPTWARTATRRSSTAERFDAHSREAEAA